MFIARCIIRNVSHQTGVSGADLRLGAKTKRKITQARWEVLRQLYETYPERSLVWYGQQLNMHHTSVLHALKKLGVYQERPRGVSVPLDEQAAREMFLNGSSVSKVALHFGVTWHRAKKALGDLRGPRAKHCPSHALRFWLPPEHHRRYQNLRKKFGKSFKGGGAKFARSIILEEIAKAEQRVAAE